MCGLRNHTALRVPRGPSGCVAHWPGSGALAEEWKVWEEELEAEEAASPLGVDKDCTHGIGAKI